MLSVLGGGLLLAVVLAEAFEALVLPRRVTRSYRLTRLYYRTAWGMWKALGALVPARWRQTWLSVFGPLSLLLLFVVWAVGLVIGFGLLQHAVSPALALPDALYLSGATFTTLGYGDITPSGYAGRALAVLEAGTGFGYFAVVVGYLPVLYQAFSRRETLISMLDARAGSPPSAGRLLLRAGPAGGVAVGRFLERAEEWAAELLESHLSYPVLGYYRSQHDNQSWLAALVCTLDASALVLTVAGGTDRPQARLTFAMARHALVDLALVLHRHPGAAADRLPPERLKVLFAALRAAGVEVRDDAAAIAALAELRGLYEPAAAALARYFGFALPDVWLEEERPDNWRTSAWARPAAPLTSLGGPLADDHFT
ncbi:MAG TPA: potassium channel family protein [Gemmataceae bacterium]|nr:potassium channel family protein [Gemmataceae bacterium]